MELKKGLAIATIFTLTTGLSACGGGSSGGASNQQSSQGGSGQQQVTLGGVVTGVASKGLLANATVTAYELDGNGKQIRSVGQATTDATGKYSISLSKSYTGGAVQLVMSANTNTTMVCDAVGGCGQNATFGQSIAAPNGLKMSALIPKVTGGAGTTVSAQITPFTDMAATNVLKSGNEVSDTAINTANARISQVVGVDILTTPPANVALQGGGSASDDSKAYGAFLSAVATQAETKDSGNISDYLSKLDNSFQDGTFSSTDPAKLTDLLDEVSNAQTTVFGSDIPAQLQTHVTNLQNQITKAGGSYTPDVTVTTGLQQAKTLVNNARTLVTSFTNLSSPAQSFADKLNSAGETFNVHSQVLLEDATSIALSVINDISSNNQISLGQARTVAIMDAGSQIGNATVTVKDDASNNLMMEITTSGIANVDFTGSIDTNIPDTLVKSGQVSLSNANLTLNADVKDTTSDATEVKLDQIKVGLTTQSAVTLTDSSGAGGNPLVTGATLTGGINISSNGYSFTGTVKNLKLVQLNSSARKDSLTGVSLADSPVSISNISVKGTFSDNAGSQFDASADLTLDNAASFDSLSYLSYQPRVWLNLSLPGDVSNAKGYYTNNYPNAGSFSDVNYSDWNDQTCFNNFNSCASGDVLGVYATLAGEVKNKFGVAPNSLSNVYYSYSTNNISTYYAEADLGSFETSNYFAKGSLTLGLDASLNGYPKASVALTVNRTELDGGNATAEIAYGNTDLTFKTSTTDINATNGGINTLTVSDPSGATMTITRKSGSNATDLQGTISVGGTQEGTVSTSSKGIVTVNYSDGTFATLQ